MHPFLADESGAITVDWAVIAAAAIGVSILVAGAVRIAGTTRADALAAEMAAWAGDTPAGAQTNYRPTDVAAYGALVSGLRGMNRDDLDTLAGFVNARTYAADRSKRLRDLRGAVDAIYASEHGGTRTHEIEFDREALEDVWERHGIERLLAPY